MILRVAVSKKKTTAASAQIPLKILETLAAVEKRKIPPISGRKAKSFSGLTRINSTIKTAIQQAENAHPESGRRRLIAAMRTSIKREKRAILRGLNMLKFRAAAVGIGMGILIMW
jgi:hypothetical protein